MHLLDRVMIAGTCDGDLRRPHFLFAACHRLRAVAQSTSLFNLKTVYRPFQAATYRDLPGGCFTCQNDDRAFLKFVSVPATNALGRVGNAAQSMPVNREPRSEWTRSSFFGFRRHTASAADRQVPRGWKLAPGHWRRAGAWSRFPPSISQITAPPSGRCFGAIILPYRSFVKSVRQCFGIGQNPQKSALYVLPAVGNRLGIATCARQGAEEGLKRRERG